MEAFHAPEPWSNQKLLPVANLSPLSKVHSFQATLSCRVQSIRIRVGGLGTNIHLTYAYTMPIFTVITVIEYAEMNTSYASELCFNTVMKVFNGSFGRLLQHLAARQVT